MCCPCPGGCSLALCHTPQSAPSESSHLPCFFQGLGWKQSFCFQSFISSSSFPGLWALLCAKLLGYKGLIKIRLQPPRSLVLAWECLHRDSEPVRLLQTLHSQLPKAFFLSTCGCFSSPVSADSCGHAGDLVSQELLSPCSGHPFALLLGAGIRPCANKIQQKACMNGTFQVETRLLF